MRGVVVGLASLLVATSGAWAHGPSKVAAGAGEAKAPIINLDEDVSQLTNQEKQARATKMVNQVGNLVEATTNELNAAVGSNNVAQQRCINSKFLPALTSLQKIAQDSQRKLNEAVGLGASAADVVNAEFLKITVANTRAAALRSQLKAACVDESNVYAGETEMDVEVDESVKLRNPNLIFPPPFAPGTPELGSLF